MPERPAPPDKPSPDDPRTWVGATVVGSRGELLGYLGPVYSDNAGHPVWAAVQGTRHTAVVPIEVTRFDGTTLHLPFGAQKLGTAPHHDPDTQLSYGEGDDLYRHYGLTPPTRSGAGEDAAMIRSEERLRVTGTEMVVTGRVRMRKRIVTEDQSFTVPVSREEITFDFDEIPPDERVPDGGGELSENTYEVIRYEERVVITKELVPVERVRMVRRVVATDRTVVGPVRTELVDVEQTDTR